MNQQLNIFQIVSDGDASLPYVATAQIATRGDAMLVQIGAGVVAFGRWPEPEAYADFIFSFDEWRALVIGIDTEISRQLAQREGGEAC